MSRFGVLLIAIFLCLFSGAANAQQPTTITLPTPTPETSGVTNTLDMRYAGSYQFLEYYRTDGRLILPDIVIVRLPGFQYHEIVASAGYLIVADKNLLIALEGGVSFGSNGERWFAPQGAISFTSGRLTTNAFFSLSVPINARAYHKYVIDPADIEYKLTNKFGIGASFTGVCVEKVWQTKLGPMIRYHANDSTTVELRVTQVNPGQSTEAQIRLIKSW